VLVATFVFSLTALRGVRADQPVPAPAMLVTSVLSAVSLVAVLAYISHIARQLRVDSIMRGVHEETIRAIDAFCRDYAEPAGPRLDTRGAVPAEGTLVRAPHSGFVRTIQLTHLVTLAAADDAVVRLEVRPGDHVVFGTPLATVWWRHAGTDPGPLEHAVGAAVSMGYERTIEQDAGFGFRELTDIAVKALSPAINDPVTAAHSIGHMGDLAARLTGKRLGPQVHVDASGVGRVEVPDRDLRYYLDLVCGQIRRYGEQEPTVLVALLRMLRDVAAHTRDDSQRAEVQRQVSLIVDEVPATLADVDRQGVLDLAARVQTALRGDLAAAYRDRSGETRSL
jgi:uncharacterized membrane protein